MSHFTVTVRLPAHLEVKDIKSALQKIMRPYYEQGKEDDDFMQFVDQTEELQSEWNEHKQLNVVEYDGKFYFPWDSKLYNKLGLTKDLFSNKIEDEVIVKAGGVFKDISVQTMYSSFEEYCHEYHGLSPNKDGKYGYLENPNAKWDWYEIGGRWTGHFPVVEEDHCLLGSPGIMTDPASPYTSDIVRIKNIDFNKAQKDSKDEVEKFLKEYQEYYNNPIVGYSECRSLGLHFGLIQCLDENEITEEHRSYCKLSKWKQNPERYDVLYPIPLKNGKVDSEFKQLLYGYLNPLRTYAFVDENGWIEPGQMGWWGMSSDTPESMKKYADQFMKWLLDGNQDDWVVCVDCHI